jgi:hypothetical protein
MKAPDKIWLSWYKGFEDTEPAGSMAYFKKKDNEWPKYISYDKVVEMIGKAGKSVKVPEISFDYAKGFLAAKTEIYNKIQKIGEGDEKLDT